jgi:hypothetical protein
MDRKKIAWRDQAKAQRRAIDRPTALRILQALTHFASGRSYPRGLPSKSRMDNLTLFACKFRHSNTLLLGTVANFGGDAALHLTFTLGLRPKKTFLTGSSERLYVCFEKSCWSVSNLVLPDCGMRATLFS